MILLEPVCYQLGAALVDMGAALNVRDAPSGDAAIVGMVEGRERFVPTAIKGNWLRIRCPKSVRSPDIPESLLQDGVWIMWQQSGRVIWCC